MTDDELRRAKEELDQYPGEEISVVDAVRIMSRVTGVKIHMLQASEVHQALENARRLIESGKVREGPFEVKNEIVKATAENWACLSKEARSLVGALWASETDSDMVMTAVELIQPKDKILDLIWNILQQKVEFGWGRS